MGIPVPERGVSAPLRFRKKDLEISCPHSSLSNAPMVSTLSNLQAKHEYNKQELKFDKPISSTYERDIILWHHKYPKC